MKSIVLVPLLVVTSAAQAAPTPVKPAASSPVAVQAMPQRFPGVSEAGNAVLVKARSTADPQLQALARQLKAARDQLTTAVMAPVIDIDKVTTALRQEEAIQSQIRSHNNDRLLAVLKQMPEEDRGTFLRTLVMARATRGPGSTPAAPPATPQP